MFLLEDLYFYFYLIGLTSMFEYLCRNWKGKNGTYQRIQKFRELENLLLIKWTCQLKQQRGIKGVFHSTPKPKLQWWW